MQTTTRKAIHQMAYQVSKLREALLNTEEMETEKKKEAQRAPWELGDFGALARTFGADAARTFVVRLPLPSAPQVLDIACGTGAATLPIARRGATVTGLDMVSKHLAEADREAKNEGLSIRFDEGFAEDLPYPDQTFDVTVSMFGAMFSAKPDRVVAEIARVLRPGGLLAMANWTPLGFSGLMAKLPSKYLPRSATAISPMLWGEQTTARARLDEWFTSIQCKHIEIEWRADMGVSDSVRFFLANAGPVQALLSRLDEQSRPLFRKDLEELWVKENIANSTNKTIIKNEYLEVIAYRNSQQGSPKIGLSLSAGSILGHKDKVKRLGSLRAPCGRLRLI